MEVVSWLKESILGIIILGALGSAVCIGTIKLIHSIIVKWAPSSITRYRGWRADKARGIGKTLKYFHKNEHQVGLVSFIVFKALRSMIYAIISIAIFAGFIFMFGREPKVLTYGNYVVLVLSMITAFVSYSEYREIRMIAQVFEREANKQRNTDSGAEAPPPVR